MRSVWSDEHVSAGSHCGPQESVHDAKTAAIREGQAFARRVCEGQELLRAFKEELANLCTGQEDHCPPCPRLDACNELVTSVVTRLLNAATDLVHEEQAFMNLHRANEQRRRHFAEHAASHEMMINDLSSYAMDCGRLPPSDLIAATTLLLKYWTESHAAYHDAVLCDMALNELPDTQH